MVLSAHVRDMWASVWKVSKSQHTSQVMEAISTPCSIPPCQVALAVVDVAVEKFFQACSLSTYGYCSTSSQTHILDEICVNVADRDMLWVLYARPGSPLSPPISDVTFHPDQQETVGCCLFIYFFHTHLHTQKARTAWIGRAELIFPLSNLGSVPALADVTHANMI